jgi:hypothetical protein
MVKNNEDSNDTDNDVEITNDESVRDDIEIEDIEEKSTAKLKQLREKLKSRVFKCSQAP